MTQSKIKPFYVIAWNNISFIPYDIMPHLMEQYKSRKKKVVLNTRQEVMDFIKGESLYQWWGRCEYEVILSDWPGMKEQKKIDVYEQLMMNLDIVADIFIDNLDLDVK